MYGFLDRLILTHHLPSRQRTLSINIHGDVDFLHILCRVTLPFETELYPGTALLDSTAHLPNMFRSPMPPLNLTIEKPTGNIVIDKTLDFLRDFLQPTTALSLRSTACSILDVLPDKAPNSTEVWCFGETCIDLAEQIPYNHPSQVKLAALLEYLGKSTKLNTTYTLEVPYL